MISLESTKFSCLPSEFHTEIPKIFISIDQLRNQFPMNYRHLRDEETIHVKPYPLKRDMPPWDTHFFPENYVFTLPRGKVFGRDGIGITPSNEIITSTMQNWQRNQDPFFQTTAMPPLTYSDQRIAVIALNGAECYYHWMFEILPRLKILQDSGIDFDKLYVPTLRSSFQRETLKKCGIYDDQLIEGDINTYIEAKELIIPSLVTRACCTHPLWVCQYLRNLFLEKPVHNVLADKKLLIVRREFTSKSKRRIINESEIVRLLEPQGFKKVILEDLKVSEQATLFSSAKMIVAAHGAGLTNLVFCKPGTKVIEVFNPDHLDETYWFLSDQLGLEHNCILPSTEPLTSEQKENCDIFLPPELLKQYLSF